jgi:hypothetical protein
VWICRRVEIARHWIGRYPEPTAQPVKEITRLDTGGG